jgi:hypothetical protein
MPMRRQRSRLTWLVAGLLLLEVAGLVLIQLTVIWAGPVALQRPPRSATELGMGATAVSLAPAAAVALVAAANVLVVPRRSWLVAMLAQVVTLGACLALHAELPAGRSPGLAALMGYSVLLVPYLNSGVVRTALLPVHRVAGEGFGGGTGGETGEGGGSGDATEAGRAADA